MISISILQGIYDIEVYSIPEQSKEENRGYISRSTTFCDSQSNTPEIVLNANKVSAYVAGTNEVTLTKIIIAVL